MNLFYSTSLNGKTISIKGQEAKHCSRVLRKSRGDTIYIIDGKGGRYECEIVNISKDEVETVIINQTILETNPCSLQVAVGIIKSSSRMEWMLEKLVELGIRQFTPLICQRSERQKVNMNRLKKIAVSATKQSMGYYIPEINEPMHLKDFLENESNTLKYIASYDPEAPSLFDIADRGVASTILIGPEGDFTQHEIELCEQNQYHRVILGNRRLRTETAAIVAATILNAH